MISDRFESLEDVRPPERVTDEGRLASLDSYDILDTTPEEGFDAVVQLAQTICDTPVALISFVAKDRQWFKARAGFEPCETNLESSVCAYALAEPDLLVIPDLTKDARTRDNPLVTAEPRIRFYAGAPLRAPNGQPLGSLCVIDVEPRPQGLSPKQAESLRSLASQVMAQLELRRALSERDRLLVGRREADVRRHALLQLGDRLRDVSTADEMILAASEIVGRALNVTRAGFGYLDEKSEQIDVVSDWTAAGMTSIAGRHRFEAYGELLPTIMRGDPLVIEDVRTDVRTAADPGPMLRLDIAALVNVPVRDGGRTVAMLMALDDKPRLWTEEELVFLRNVADRLEVGVGRLRAEADQRVLNSELSHRMKNMMAMVQAIATQTLKSVPEREPVEALMKRIVALASAHDALLKEDWSSAPIRVIATTALDAFGLAGRFDLEGPDVDLGPRATLGLSMLMHEMITNALKYGSLSVETGRVSVSWRVDDDDAGSEFAVDWREREGPAVQEPVTKGFGSRLIGTGLVGTGGANVRYPTTGLEAEFRAPIGQVTQA